MRTQPTIESIAVLPLVNVSSDAGQEYFADGVTEALITDLGKIASLKVISRTSAMRYKGSEKSLPEIASELGVDAVVEGSVLRAGSHIRINVQLVDAANDSHLWAESYEHDLVDVLRIQSEVARVIATHVQAKLTAQEQARLTNVQQVDPEAYEHYLKGRYHWHKVFEAELRKGMDHFRQAIEKDPNYGQAYSGLADSYIILNIRGYASAAATNNNAKLAARRALEIDNNLSEAHTSLARALVNNWEWSAADPEFKVALALNPGYVETHHAYSHYLIAMGYPERSLVESQHALRLAPVDPIMIGHLAWHYLMARDIDSAIEIGRKMLEFDPHGTLAHYILGQAYEEKLWHRQAVAELQQAVSLSKGSPETLAGLGHAHALAGSKPEALKILDHLVKLSSERYISPVYMALVCTSLGDKDQAFTWLSKAYEEHSAQLMYLKVDPKLDPLRDDARFYELVAGMNFPD